VGDLNPYMAGCQVAYADGTDEPTPEHLEIVQRVYEHPRSA
jgi:hypothetical protein